MLVFVGVKMVIADWVKLPQLLSLGVIIVLVGGSIVASMVRNERLRLSGGPDTPATPAPGPS